MKVQQLRFSLKRIQWYIYIYIYIIILILWYPYTGVRVCRLKKIRFAALSQRSHHMSIVPYLIPTDRLFVPQLFRDNNNQNIKTLYYWAFGSGIIRMTSGFPSQGSNYYGICFHINVGPCIYSFWSFFRVTTPVTNWLRCVKDLRFKCYFDIVSI